MVANRLANSHASLADEYREAGALPQAVEQYAPRSRSGRDSPTSSTVSAAC